MLQSLYRSGAGRPMSGVARAWASISRPRMIYGYVDPGSGQFRRFVRLGSDVVVIDRKRLSIGDHVWVGHHSVLDASEGLEIGEGAQLGVGCGVYTHGSEASIRLLGREYVNIPADQRPGYTRGPVKIGEFAFLGAYAIVLAGVTIGKGSLVSPLSLVARDIPDYAIVSGSPARVIGDTRNVDAEHFEAFDYSRTYYDTDALEQVREQAIGHRSSMA